MGFFSKKKVDKKQKGWALSDPPGDQTFLLTFSESRNVEQGLPCKDSVGQLALGFGKQVDIEGVDFLARFNCGVDTALNPLAVAD